MITATELVEEFCIVEVEGAEVAFFGAKAAGADGGVVVGSWDGEAGDADFAIWVAAADAECENAFCI